MLAKVLILTRKSSKSSLLCSLWSIHFRLSCIHHQAVYDITCTFSLCTSALLLLSTISCTAGIREYKKPTDGSRKYHKENIRTNLINCLQKVPNHCLFSYFFKEWKWIFRLIRNICLK